MQVAPYGTWPSPLTPDAIVAGSVRLGDAAIQSNTRIGPRGVRPRLVAWFSCGSLTTDARRSHACTLLSSHTCARIRRALFCGGGRDGLVQ